MADSSEVVAPLALPRDREWTRIGVRLGAELHAGHQSRVFRAELDRRAIVVKLTDSRLTDEAYETRVDLCRRVADMNPSVVGPVPIDGALVTRLDDWFVVASPFVIGIAPDLAGREDVARMGAALAGLHDSLRTLGAVDVPPLAALRDDIGAVGGAEFAGSQLLHGDFSDANILLGDSGLRIVDFDDCGYGPIEFEVGNSLYMVLFDAVMTDNKRRYDRFREWFVDSYRSSSGATLTDAALDAAIALRIHALGRWLDDLSLAPIGIRSSSPEWRRELRAFVDSQ